MRTLRRNSLLSVRLPLVAIAILSVTVAGTAQSIGGDLSAKSTLAFRQSSAPAQAQVTARAGKNRKGTDGDAQGARQDTTPLDTAPPFFLPAVLYTVADTGGIPLTSVAIKDLNGDGYPDIAVTTVWNYPYCGNGTLGTVEILLGNSDGTFGPAATYCTAATWASSLAIADVNGDSKPDLVVGNAGANWISVLLGNGDGTFGTAVRFDSGGYQAWSVAVADVNGDGRLDVLVANYDDDSLGVLLGNGDGTFQPAITYSSGNASGGPITLAVADVSGDHKPDLLAALSANNTVAVLLGYGDGSFGVPVAYNSGGSAPSVLTVADVNGDHKPDLLVANSGSNTVSVLLGKGDGTFQSPATYDAGGYGPGSVSIADVNGDGKSDLVVANCGSGGACGNSVVAVLLGNGDGTFQSPMAWKVGFGMGLGAVGDVNGDGLPDFVGAGGFVGVMLHVGETPTTTAVVSSPNPSVYGEPVTLTATVSSPSGTPTGMVAFFGGSTELGNSTLVGGVGSLSYAALPVGSNSITAVYQGSLKFNSSASTPLNQVVTAASTTTSLAPSKNPISINKAVTYIAYITSQYDGPVSGTVTFQDGGIAVATEPAANWHAVYTTSYKTRGTHAMIGIYSGDSNNMGSVSPTLLEQVRGYSSKTVVATSGSPSFVGQAVTFTATVTSKHGALPDGELITFYDGKTVLGSAALAGGTAKYTTSSLSAKMHTIHAGYPGDSIYEPSSGLISQVVNKYPTTTSLASSPNPSNYGQTVTFTATVTASGPYSVTGKVRFFDGNTGIGTATLSGGLAKLKSSTLTVGTHAITAQYLSDAYNDKSISTVVNQVVQ